MSLLSRIWFCFLELRGCFGWCYQTITVWGHQPIFWVFIIMLTWPQPLFLHLNLGEQFSSRDACRIAYRVWYILQTSRTYARSMDSLHLIFLVYYWYIHYILCLRMIIYVTCLIQFTLYWHYIIYYASIFFLKMFIQFYKSDAMFIIFLNNSLNHNAYKHSVKNFLDWPYYAVFHATKGSWIGDTFNLGLMGYN